MNVIFGFFCRSRTGTATREPNRLDPSESPKTRKTETASSNDTKTKPEQKLERKQQQQNKEASNKTTHGVSFIKHLKNCSRPISLIKVFKGSFTIYFFLLIYEILFEIFSTIST